jgi:hypothetical protein
VEILSVVLHAAVYLKIHLYKKKWSANNNLLSVHKLDTEAMTSFGINLLVIACLGSTTIMTRWDGFFH